MKLLAILNFLSTSRGGTLSNAQDAQYVSEDDYRLIQTKVTHACPTDVVEWEYYAGSDAGECFKGRSWEGGKLVSRCPGWQDAGENIQLECAGSVI